jgi:hypothetical protein
MKFRTPVIAALLSTTLLASTASYAGDRALAVLLGTGAGAVIGRSVGGRDGAVIGATAGALLALSAQNQRRDQQYGNGRQYNQPASQVYYSAPLPTYQQQYEQHYQQINPAFQVVYERQYPSHYQQQAWEQHRHHEWRHEHFRERREYNGWGH